MKTILILTALATSIVLTACDSMHNNRSGRAPVVGATTGVKSQSTHAGNSDGSRTDLR
jgi:hypothetical protein